MPVLTDPTGEFAFLIPWLIKAGTEAAVDALMQATINYFFDPNVSTVNEAFSSIDWWQVGWAGATALIPGGGLAKAAIVAAGDVVIEALQAWSRCEEYTPQQALFTFAVGIASELIGEKLGDLLVKYGTPVVAAGLKKLGFDDMAERLLRNADEAVDDVLDDVVDGPDNALVGPGHTNPAGFTYTSDLAPNDPRIIQKQSILDENVTRRVFAEDGSLVTLPFADRDYFGQCEVCSRKMPPAAARSSQGAVAGPRCCAVFSQSLALWPLSPLLRGLLGGLWPRFLAVPLPFFGLWPSSSLVNEWCDGFRGTTTDWSKKQIKRGELMIVERPFCVRVLLFVGGRWETAAAG